MKYLLILVALLLVAGCDKKDDLKKVEDYYTSTYGMPRSEFAPDVAGIVVMDSCQYFQIASYGHWTYTHKGNCNNPEHKRK